MTEERNKKCGTGCASKTVVASIALNLFLVGVVVAPLLGLRGGPDRGPMAFDGPPPPREPGFMLRQVAKTLPPQEAGKLRAIFDQERKDMMTRHGDRRETMQKLVDILKSETPDKEALRTVMNEIRLSGQGIHESMTRALERVATEISVEGRRKIAEAIERDRGFDHGPDRAPPPEE